MITDPHIPIRIKESGKRVPDEVLTAAVHAAAVIEKGEETDATKEIKLVEAWVESYFLPFLEPGPDPESDAPADWKPCGQADGVIYRAGLKDSKGERWVVPGQLRQALRYLKAPSILERATRAALEGRDRISGYAQPRLGGLFRHCPGIRIWGHDVQKSRRHNEPIINFFALCDRAVQAVQPEHRNRWVIRKPEEGIWCVFYV